MNRAIKLIIQGESFDRSTKIDLLINMFQAKVVCITSYNQG